MSDSFTKSLEIVLEIMKFLFTGVFRYFSDTKTAQLENLRSEINKETPNICVIQEEFYKVYKIILDADEIIKLSKDNRCFRVIQYMKKFPEITIYKDGKLSYFRKNQKTIHEISDKLWKITLYALFFCSILLLIFSPFIQACIIITVIIIYLLAMDRYRLSYQRLDDLIDSYNV